MSEVALSNGGWDLEQVGHLLRDPSLSYEDYAQICTDIGHMHYAVRQVDAALRFATGDAILMGETLFGEECYQAVEEMGISEGVKQECVRLARQIPRSRRRLKTLTWSHHRAVAALPPPEQKEWLKRAEDEGMSHHALRDELRPPDVQPEKCECCGRRLP